MQLHFTGKNLEVTAALKNYTTEKLQHLDKRFQLNNVNIVFTVEHITHIAEANLQFHNTELHAKAESQDMYAAVDALIDKLSHQLLKHKEKLIDSHR